MDLVEDGALDEVELVAEEALVYLGIHFLWNSVQELSQVSKSEPDVKNPLSQL